MNASDNDSLQALKGKKFDAIIDFTGTAKRVGDVLAKDVSHVIAYESLWMFGYPKILPCLKLVLKNALIRVMSFVLTIC